MPQHLEGEFDIVYRSRGVLHWLPDIERWVEVVAHLVKPGGASYILEAHPTFMVFENEGEGEPVVRYPYLQWSGADDVRGSRALR